MTWNLFIDDEREIADVTWAPWEVRLRFYNETWVVCRDSFEVYLEIAKRGEFPTFISFDHDLGDGQETGYDIAKELISRDMSDHSWVKIPDNFAFYVHSQNPIGKANIEGLLNNYLKFRKEH